MRKGSERSEPGSAAQLTNLSTAQSISWSSRLGALHMHTVLVLV